MSFAERLKALREKKAKPKKSKKPKVNTDDDLVETVESALSGDTEFNCPWNGIAFSRMYIGFMEFLPDKLKVFFKRSINTDYETVDMRNLIRSLKSKVNDKKKALIDEDLKDIKNFFRRK